MNGIMLSDVNLSEVKSHVESLVPPLAEKLCSSNADLSVIYQGCKYLQQVFTDGIASQQISPADFVQNAYHTIAYSPQVHAFSESLLRAVVDERTLTHRIIVHAYTAAHTLLGKLQ
jgi:hypothetical protein